jgi:hypothetical protein
LTSAAQWVGNGSLGVLVVVSLVRGWLIPRRTHLDRVADLKAAIAALEETVHERETQISILLGRKDPVA